MIIKLSSSLPRSLEELKKVPLKKGLRLYFFFAYFLFGAAALGFLSGILNIIYTNNWKLGIVQMIFGTGFPAFRGGLLRYADALGVATVVQKLEALQKSCGSSRFEPCAWLKARAAAGVGFYS